MAGRSDLPGALESRAPGARRPRAAPLSKEPPIHGPGSHLIAGCLLAAAATAATPPAARPGGTDDAPAPAPAAAIAWNDWSPETFAKAVAADKPILLYVRTAWSRASVWNEEKIHTDPQVVKLATERWIPVRVDRDRRPDIDQRYQIAVQAVSKGEGGWPLTALLFPTGEALSGRSFVPLEDRGGKPGLRTLLEKTADYYAANHGKVEGLRALVMLSFDRERAIARAPEIRHEVIEETVSGMLKWFDRENGGFGPSPRVVLPYPVELAAVLLHRTGDPSMREVMVKSLEGMERGAIHDRIGGGFHRASADVTWRYPEFEKLLNYNAALLVDYLLGYQATEDVDLRRAAEGIVDYLLGTLQDPAGGFYVGQWAAGRADDPRAEYYAFTEEEFRKAVPPGDEAIAGALFHVTPEGELLLGPPPRSLAYLTMSRKEVAERLETTETKVRHAETEILEGLRRQRAGRTPPPVEKAIYVDSCSAAAAALIEAGLVLGRADAREAGLKALDRLLAALPGSGPLLHRVQPPPEAAIDRPFALDHIMLARAAMAGYEATGDRRYLDASRGVLERAVTLFWDPADGGFFDIAAEPGAIGFLSVRRRLPNDTAYPSLNSLAARVLDRLWLHTRDAVWHTRAETCLKGLIAASEKLDQHDSGISIAVAASLWPPARYLVVGPADDPAARSLAELAERLFDPDKLVLRLVPGRDDDEISRMRPRGEEGRAYVVVCRGASCSGPSFDEGSLRKLATVAPAAPPASEAAPPRR